MSNVELVQVLEGTASGDQNSLSFATQYLDSCAQNNFPALVKDLSTILRDVTLGSVARLQAALQLKNQVYSRDPVVRKVYFNRWRALPEEIRNAIKANCLDALGTEVCRPSQAAQCVGYIACCELPIGDWANLIGTLVEKVVSPSSPNTVREAALEAIGYVCHDLPIEFLQGKSNEILTAIVYGMMADQKDDKVKLAATNALLNSLEFTKQNFEVEAERNYIMQVVCEATQSTDVKICVTALQVLVKIASLYYQYMATYMEQALFGITLEAIRSTTDEIALQGIEFWSTICDEELDIVAEAEQARLLEDTTLPTRISLNFAASACNYLVPDLLERLKQQDENDDEDDWKPCKAAGVCLMLMAETTGDRLIEPVMTFVNTNIQSSDWRARDAAVMAFGSIVVDPPGENLIALAEQALLALMTMMNDSSIVVRDSVAWALGRLCDNIPDVCLSDKYLQPLLETMLKALDDQPRVAHNVCWALSSLANVAHGELSPFGDTTLGTYKLSGSFGAIIKKMLDTTERQDANQNHLRSAGYETIISFVRSSARDCYPCVKELYGVILTRLEHVLSVEEKGCQGCDPSEVSEVQAMLCATLQAIVQKLDLTEALLTGDRTVQSLMRVLSSPLAASSGAQEDAVCALSILCGTMKTHFGKYIDSLIPFVIQGIQNHTSKQAFIVYLGFFGDICRAIENAATPYCDKIIHVMFECLRDERLDVELRPQVLTLFGDMAATNGQWFTQYLSPTMTVLKQAATAKVDMSNPDLADYANSLHEACLMALTGIVQGYQSAGTDDLNALFPYTSFMISFIIEVTRTGNCPDSITHAAIGLVGDLLTVFGAALDAQMRQKEISDLLARGKESTVAKTRNLANWATNELRRKLSVL